MKINNKGFSMVEILAVVVILGVISTIGIVSVTRLIDNSRKHYYKAQTDQLVLAAQSYANDNKNILPKTIGGTTTVYLDKLIEKKYITEEIVDQNKTPCYTKDQVVDGKKVKGSRVDIYKSSKSDYKYVGHLECNACQKENTEEGDYSCSDKNKEDPPKIAISMTKLNSTTQGNNIYDNSNNITITMDAVEKTDGYDQKVKISSYSIKIYVDGVIKYNSGLKINNKKDRVVIEEKLNKYIPGKVTVIVTLTNTLGQTVTKSKSEDYRDAQPPLCGHVTYEGPYPLEAYDSQSSNIPKCGTNKNKWINSGSRYVWLHCNDENGLGCVQHEFSKNFNSEGATDTVTIKDINGKTQTCTVNKCIDLTTTQVTINVYKRKSNGGKDGGVKQTVTVNKVQSANTTVYKEYSGWVNGVNYPNGVIIEVVLKDSLSNVKSLTWKENAAKQKDSNNLNANQTVRPKSSDTLGTSTTYTATHEIITEGVRKEVITVEDTAGNKITVNYKIKIDLTKPNCNISKDPNHLYKTDGVILTTKCNDNPDISGINKCEKKHTGVKKDQKYTVTDVAGNSNTCRIDVYSQRQESIRTRTWNTCHHTINTCKGGYTAGCTSAHPTEEAGPIGGCKHNRCCGKEGYNTNCHCRPWSDCKTGNPAKCVAGWNNWGSYSNWKNVNSCSAGKYHKAHGSYDHERKCRTLYY